MKKIKLGLAALAILSGLSTAYGQDFSSLIKNKLNSASFTAPELVTVDILSVDQSASMQAKVVKFQQLYKGIPVYNAVGTALVRGNEVSYLTENFEHTLTNKPAETPAVSAQQSFKKVASALGMPSENFQWVAFGSGGAPADRTVQHRLVYLAENGKLRLAHELIFAQPKATSYWDVLTDATTGEILSKEDLTISCAFDPTAAHDDAHLHDAPQSAQQKILAAKAADNATYKVFQLPLEAPTFGAATLVTNPHDPVSSPEGWHSTGANHYTITRGNNVYAYEDAADADVPGYSPDGGATRIFDFPIDLNQTTGYNRDAAITNLFYINNKVHDIFYKFGFRETSRNFQVNNFGKGGVGNDAVNAEAQDGGGTNNANFATPPDGTSGRMQMYLWNPSAIQLMFYNTPASAVPRKPKTAPADFGPDLATNMVTANVKLADAVDACTALPAGSMTGQIGLVERGTCSFVVKVKNVQNAGGLGAIIYNLPTSAMISYMSGTDSTITIPSILIENSEGVYMKDLLASGTTVNVTLKDDPSLYIYKDGSFDNGIVVHEYGHGISNRNTGNGYSCLYTNNSVEQMGEGWSDFFALMLTNQPGATAAVPRGIGTFAIGQPTTGGGIRQAKYSPDKTINSWQYGQTNNLTYTNSSGATVPNVHAIGFVWASILWDLHWKYVNKYGYASDVTANPNSGSARVLQLVMDGLKLQECNPTFVSGRNAILQAEMATTGGADKCMIWQAFADRGVGVNASAGSKTNIGDQVADFTVPTECLAGTSEAKGASTVAVYPNPASTEINIHFPANAIGKASVELYDASGKLVYAEDRIAQTSDKKISTASLPAGVYTLKVISLGEQSTTKIMIKK